MRLVFLHFPHNRAVNLRDFALTWLGTDLVATGWKQWESTRIVTPEREMPCSGLASM